MATKLIAIVAGVGPGTGAAVARKFAAQYPVALLARSPASYNDIVKEINESGGKAIGISTDVVDPKSVKNAFETIRKEYGNDVAAAAAIFNASGSFTRKPFLEITEEEFGGGLDVSTRGAFHFSQSALELLLKGVDSSANPPSLIFTGATASVKSNAMLASFAPAKHALRSMTLSIAKEFGPKGIHVSHTVIDGIIDTEKTKEWMKDGGPESKLSPDGIADAYWNLHVQPKSVWSWEVDLRPWVEKW